MAEGDRRFIMQATRFVLEHLDEPDFNINLLCHEMAMSRTLFYSRLKSLTGKGRKSLFVSSGYKKLPNC